MSSTENQYQQVDHRTRVGQERRQKMRMRLLESALLVYAEKGIDASVIDDVIVKAGVSRGTFYNYFRANSDVVTTLGEILSNEIVSQIEKTVGELPDPVEVLATGLRMFLQTTKDYPHYASFIWKAGFNAQTAQYLIYDYLPRHIKKSVAQGSFRVKDEQIAFEIIVGIMLATIFSLSTRSPGPGYPECMVKHALMALGISEPEAERLVRLPLPSTDLDANSLLVRAHS